MNALADEKVGEYLNENFVSTYQKVGTFQIVDGRKQGGNVASYFCTEDGRVLHAIAGPVDAKTLLREARWVIDTRKMARVESKGDLRRFAGVFQKAHLDRLVEEQGLRPRGLAMPPGTPVDAMATAVLASAGRKGASNEAKVHLLLCNMPLVRLDDIYAVVWEKVLNEKVSTAPVAQKGVVQD